MVIQMDTIEGLIEEVYADGDCKIYAKKRDSVVIECKDGRSIEIGKDLMNFLASLLDL